MAPHGTAGAPATLLAEFWTAPAPADASAGRIFVLDGLGAYAGKSSRVAVGDAGGAVPLGSFDPLVPSTDLPWLLGGSHAEAGDAVRGGTAGTWTFSVSQTDDNKHVTLVRNGTITGLRCAAVTRAEALLGLLSGVRTSLSSADKAQVDFAFHFSGSGHWQPRVAWDGSLAAASHFGAAGDAAEASASVPCAAGDAMELQVDAAEVRWVQNGVVRCSLPLTGDDGAAFPFRAVVGTRAASVANLVPDAGLQGDAYVGAYAPEQLRGDGTAWLGGTELVLGGIAATVDSLDLPFAPARPGDLLIERAAEPPVLPAGSVETVEGGVAGSVAAEASTELVLAPAGALTFKPDGADAYAAPGGWQLARRTPLSPRSQRAPTTPP